MTDSTTFDLTADDLRPADYNPRSLSEEAAGGLRASLREFGDIAGITFNVRTGRLVTGHQRVDQLRKQYGRALRLEPLAGDRAQLVTPSGDVFAVRLVEWDAGREKAANITANNPHIGGEFTDDLEAILREVEKSDAELFGRLRLDDLLGDIEVEAGGEKQGRTDPDAVPEPDPVAVSRLGDLWILGSHRLLCGSSREAADVRALMNGKRATLFATDPPYLVDYKGEEWDSAAQGGELFADFIARAKEHAIVENAAWYCWHASRRQAMVEAEWEKAGAFVHQQIIWAKSHGVLTRSVMLWRHEPCFFGWLRGKKPKVNRIDPYPTTVWEIASSEVETREHPTSKPTRVFKIPMELHTDPGDVCYEPFSGSGSQIIAAEQLGRACYAMELSPIYVDLGVRRWQEFTGATATLAETGETWVQVRERRALEPEAVA